MYLFSYNAYIYYGLWGWGPDLHPKTPFYHLRRSKPGLKSAQIEIRMFLLVDMGIDLPT